MKEKFYQACIDAITTQQYSDIFPPVFKTLFETQSHQQRRLDLLSEIEADKKKIKQDAPKKSAAFFYALLSSIRAEVNQTSARSFLSSEKADFPAHGAIIHAFQEHSAILITTLKMQKQVSLDRPTKDSLFIYLEKLEEKINAGDQFSEEEWKNFCKTIMTQLCHQKQMDIRYENARPESDWKRYNASFQNNEKLEMIKLLAEKDEKIKSFLHEPMIQSMACDAPHFLSLDRLLDFLSFTFFSSNTPETLFLLSAGLNVPVKNDFLDLFIKEINSNEIKPFIPKYILKYLSLFMEKKDRKEIFEALKSEAQETYKDTIEQNKVIFHEKLTKKSISAEQADQFLNTLIENKKDDLLSLLSTSLNQDYFDELLSFIFDNKLNSIDSIFEFLSKEIIDPSLRNTINLAFMRLMKPRADIEIPESFQKEAILIIFMASMRHQVTHLIESNLVSFNKFLYEAGKEGKSGLRLAMEENIDFDFLPKIMGVSLKKTTSTQSHNFVHIAIQLKKPHYVRKGLELGIDPTEKSKKGISPLFMALQMDDAASLAILLRDKRVKQKINARSSYYNMTPLAFALSQQSTENMALLIRNGADASSAIHFIAANDSALLKSSLEILKNPLTLLQTELNGKKPIESAIAAKKVASVSLLLAYEPTHLGEISDRDRAMVSDIMDLDDLPLIKKLFMHPRYHHVLFQTVEKRSLDYIDAMYLSPKATAFMKVQALIEYFKAYTDQKSTSMQNSRRNQLPGFNAFSSQNTKVNLATSVISRLECWMNETVELEQKHGSPLLEAQWATSKTKLDSIIKNAQRQNRNASLFNRTLGQVGAILTLYPLPSQLETGFLTRMRRS